MKLVKNSILQKSFISPILVSFYLVNLLDIFKTSASFIKISENHIYNYFTYISILISLFLYM